jgi:hypothetical protein
MSRWPEVRPTNNLASLYQIDGGSQREATSALARLTKPVELLPSRSQLRLLNARNGGQNRVYIGSQIHAVGGCACVGAGGL